MNMTQLWRNDAVVPVTALRLSDPASCGLLSVGSKVAIRGRSKGRGFQGVVKRHGFGGGPKSHGQKDRLRAPGSIGATAPQRVIPGRRMAGHMGMEMKTIKSSTIAALEPDKATVWVTGSVPGMRGSNLELKIVGAAP